MSTKLLTFDHPYIVQSNAKTFLRVEDNVDLGLILTTTPDKTLATPLTFTRVAMGGRERIAGATRVYLTYTINGVRTYATFTRQLSKSLDALAADATERDNTRVYFRPMGVGVQLYALNCRLVPSDSTTEVSSNDTTRAITEDDEVYFYATHPLRGLNGVSVGLRGAEMTETDADVTPFTFTTPE